MTLNYCSYPTVVRPSGCRIETPSKTWRGLSSRHVGIRADVFHAPLRTSRMSTRLDAWRSEASSPPKSAETSLDAADTSVRATQASHGGRS
jgi:hypothetical protein